MSTENRYPVLSRYAWTLIKIKARQLAGTSGFTKDDRPDIEQVLALDLVQRLVHYDPTKSSLPTFTNRVLKHKVASLIQEKKAKKRDWRLCRKSLNDLVKLGEGNWVERHEVYDENEYFLRSGIRARRSEEIQDMKSDVRQAVEELSPRLRRLCSLLTTDTVTDIAKKLGLSRQTIYKDMEAVRKHFEKRGLREYVGAVLTDRESFR